MASIIIIINRGRFGIDVKDVAMFIVHSRGDKSLAKCRRVKNYLVQPYRSVSFSALGARGTYIFPRTLNGARQAGFIREIKGFLDVNHFPENRRDRGGGRGEGEASSLGSERSPRMISRA